MATIFDLPLTPMSASFHTSPTVVLYPQNVGIAFGISLLSSIEAQILRYFICTFGNGGYRWFTTYSVSESVHTSPT